MHILVLTFLDYPSYEGGAIRLRHLSRVLQSRGHNLTVIAPQIDFHKPPREENVRETVMRVPMHYLAHAASIPFLARWLFVVHFTQAVQRLWHTFAIRLPVDLVQIEEQFPLVRPARFIKARTGAPILLDDVVFFEQIVGAKVRRFLSPTAARIAQRLVARAEQSAFSQCDYFTYASPMANEYLNTRGYSGHIFLPNGVDTGHFKPAPRRRHHSAQERHIFFSASPRSDQNLQAIEHLLDAAPEIASRCSYPIRITIVCGPHTWVPARILRKAKSLERIVQFHDTLPDIVPLIHNADVTVLPYGSGHHITGGARLKALEYLACGTVLVSTPEGIEGLTGLQPGRHYLLAPTLSDLIDQTVRVLEQPSAYHHLGSTACRFVRQRYSWEVVMQGYLAFIESLER